MPAPRTTRLWMRETTAGQGKSSLSCNGQYTGLRSGSNGAEPWSQDLSDDGNNGALQRGCRAAVQRLRSKSTKEVQNKTGFGRSLAGLSGQIEFGVIPAKNRCFSRKNATFSILEAGGIDCAEKRDPSVKTPHLAHIAVRRWTYSDTKVHRRTRTDKEFRWSSRKSSRNGPGCLVSG